MSTMQRCSTALALLALLIACLHLLIIPQHIGLPVTMIATAGCVLMFALMRSADEAR